MKKLAVVGTGIAGMSAAYFLKDDYEITVFEKNNYVGGHTNTVYVTEDGIQKPIDSGFIVFNEVTYPHLLKLFKKLNVPYVNSDMSFSVMESQIDLEYNGSSLSGLFAQRKNLLNYKHWKMILDIRRLCKDAKNILENPVYESMDLKQFAARDGYGHEFLHHFVLPMSSAVWSTPNDKMLKFPIRTLVRFFLNHGFLGLDTQHQWKTVENGSQTYKLKLIESFKDKIKTNSQVTAVERQGNKVIVTTINGETLEFDHVVMASHADETLAMLKNPTALEVELLSPFKYEKNIAVLHTDESVMPKLKSNWSAWNFVYRDHQTFTVYYMNRLQKISDKKDYFININGETLVDPSKVLKRIEYFHPIFDQAAIKAQSKLSELNVENSPLYYCGSYFRYGFHEDALMSSVQLCEKILKRSVLP